MDEIKNTPLSKTHIEISSISDDRSEKIWQKITNRKHKTKFLIIIAAIICISIFLLKFVGSNPENNTVHNPLAVINNQSGTPSPSSTKPKSKKLFLVRQKTNNQQEKIFEFDRNTLNYIYRWKNTLIYTYMYGEADRLVIYQHDLTSGTTSKLFDKFTKDLSMSPLTIIDDTLYFYISEYMQRGESYWINLESKDRAVNILADFGGSVQKIRDQYFLIMSEGDSCWSKTDFGILDSNKKHVTKTIQTTSGCINGEEYLGVNKNNQMLVSTYISPDGNYEWPLPSAYTDLQLINLSQPYIKTDAISKNEMPKKIFVTKYLEDLDKVVLVGDAVYTYSFPDMTLMKLIEFPDEWVRRNQNIILRGENEKNICVEKQGEKDGRLSYKLNLESRSYTKNDDACMPQSESSDPSYEASSAKKIFSDLKLPSQYKLLMME